MQLASRSKERSTCINNLDQLWICFKAHYLEMNIKLLEWLTPIHSLFSALFFSSFNQKTLNTDLQYGIVQNSSAGSIPWGLDCLQATSPNVELQTPIGFAPGSRSVQNEASVDRRQSELGMSSFTNPKPHITLHIGQTIQL